MAKQYYLDVFGPRSVLSAEVEDKFTDITKKNDGHVGGSGTCFGEEPERDITFIFPDLKSRTLARREMVKTVKSSLRRKLTFLSYIDYSMPE